MSCTEQLDCLVQPIARWYSSPAWLPPEARRTMDLKDTVGSGLRGQLVVRDLCPLS